MADRYWVGGAGTWDASTTTNWSETSGGSGGASAPTSADNVFFNSASNTTAYAVTVGTNALCNDVNISGPASGNVTITMGATAIINCFGNWTNAATGVVFTTTSGANINFSAPSTGKTIITNNVSIANANFIFTTTLGGWTLGTALTCNGVFVNAGSFNTGNYTLTINSIQRAGTLTASATLGSSTIFCSGSGPITLNNTNFTLNAGTSTITCSNPAPTFTGGGLTYYNVIFSGTTGATTAIAGVNTFNTLTHAAPVGIGIRTLSINANQTIGTLTLNPSASAVSRTFVRSDSIGTKRTLIVATLTAISDIDFRDIIAAGASGTWSGTRLGDCKGNSNITFAAGVNKYFRSVNGASANWYGTVWSTSSATGATPLLNDFPLAQDTCIIDNSGASANNGLRSGNTITVDINWNIGTLDLSGRTAVFNWTQGNADPVFYGDVTLTTVMTMTTVTGTPTWSFLNQGTIQALNTAGLTLRLSSLIINSPGGGVSLTTNTTIDLSPIVSPNTTGTFNLTAGTLSLGSNTLTAVAFSAGTSTNAIAFGTGNITLTGTGTIFTGSTTTTVTGTPQVICTNNSATARTITPGTVTEANSISFRVTAGTGTFTVTATQAVRNIDFTDGINPTGYAGAFSPNAFTVYGNFKASTGMSQTSGGNAITFAATSGTKTINTAGVTFDRPFTFNGVNGTWELQSALTSGSTRTITLTNGTLTTNGYAVTAGLFLSSNTNARVLNLGASTVTLTASGANIWNISDSTNMTLNAGTSSLIFTGTTAGINFYGGSLTYYNITAPTGSGYNFQIFGINTFQNITVPSPISPGRRLVIFSQDQTIMGTLSCSGGSANSRNRLASPTTGLPVTLTVASVSSISDVDFADITLTGTAAPVSGTRLSDMLGNTGIIFDAGKTVYWNKPAGGLWSDTAWALSSGGAVNANNFPLAQDTLIFDNTGVGSGSTISSEYGWAIGSINASTLTNPLTISWSSVTGGQTWLFGDVTLSSAITFTSSASSPTAIAGKRNGGFVTVTSAGVVWTQSNINFVTVDPNIAKLADNFTASFTLSLSTGTLDLNGKTATAQIFALSAPVGLNTRSIAFNGGQIEITGNNTTVWSAADLTGFSYTGTPTVNFTYSGSVGTRTCNNGSTAAGIESNVVDFNCTAGTDTFTFSSFSSVRNLNYTGFSGVGTTINNGFIYGNLTLSPTQTIAASTNITNFAATSGIKTITTNGIPIDRNLYFTGIGGTWSLQDALTVSYERDIRFYAGTLTTNGYALTCGKFGNAGSAATGDRTLNLGSSTVTILGTSTGSTSWQVENGLFSFTVNAGTSTIYMAEAFTGSSFQYFLSENKTYYNVVYSGGQPGGFFGSNTFNSISNTVQPLTLTFEAGSTNSFYNFNLSGTTLESSVNGTQFNLYNLTGKDIRTTNSTIKDSAALPNGYWFAPIANGNVNAGNNSGWNFNSAQLFTQLMNFLVS